LGTPTELVSAPISIKSSYQLSKLHIRSSVCRMRGKASWKRSVVMPPVVGRGLTGTCRAEEQLSCPLVARRPSKCNNYSHIESAWRWLFGHARLELCGEAGRPKQQLSFAQCVSIERRTARSRRTKSYRYRFDWSGVSGAAQRSSVCRAGDPVSPAAPSKALSRPLDSPVAPGRASHALLRTFPRAEGRWCGAGGALALPCNNSQLK
jgi:hypothetical protein